MLTTVSTLEAAHRAARLTREAEALVAARRSARDNAIREALESGGHTERDVAQVTLLSPAAVHKIAAAGLGVRS